jgi:hypothetical protein
MNINAIVNLKNKIYDLEEELKQTKQNLPRLLRKAFADGALATMQSVNKTGPAMPTTKADFVLLLKEKYPDYKGN